MIAAGDRVFAAKQQSSGRAHVRARAATGECCVLHRCRGGQRNNNSADKTKVGGGAGPCAGPSPARSDICAGEGTSWYGIYSGT